MRGNFKSTLPPLKRSFHGSLFGEGGTSCGATTFEISKRQNPSGKIHLFRGKLLFSQKAMIQSILLSPRKRKAELGQFLTPPPIAEFMASLFEPMPELVRILDAGAGAGALTEALVTRVCKDKSAVRAIEVALYEIDSDILEVLLEKR